MFKNWILNKFFAKELEFYRDEKIRNAFAVAHKDILDTMKDDLDAQAEELAKKKLQDLLVSVDLNSIVRLDKSKGFLWIGTERANPEQLLNLKSEAEYIANTNLWKLLHETPKELAQKAMFENDGTLDNLLLKGRAILFTLSTQENILNTFKSYEPKK